MVLIKFEVNEKHILTGMRDLFVTGIFLIPTFTLLLAKHIIILK